LTEFILYYEIKKIKKIENFDENTKNGKNLVTRENLDLFVKKHKKRE